MEAYSLERDVFFPKIAAKSIKTRVTMVCSIFCGLFRGVLKEPEKHSPKLPR